MLRATTDEFSISPKLKVIYGDFKLVSETSSYKVFEALTRRFPQKKHMIRIIDSTSSDFVRNNFSQVATLFVQELLRLQQVHPGSVLTHTFEITENAGKQISCATLPYIPLSLQSQGTQEVVDLKDTETITKILNDILSDVEFLQKELGMGKIIDSLGLRNVWFLKEKGAFILANWTQILERNILNNENLTESMFVSKISQNEGTSKELEDEMKSFGLAVLKANNVDTRAIEKLLSELDSEPEMVNVGIAAKLSKVFKDSQQLQDLLLGLLTSDPGKSSNLKELNRRMNKAASTEFKAPKLLAWCSQTSNKISIIELETENVYAKIDGLKLQPNECNGLIFHHEISNTSLLVSLHHNYTKSAALEIYDVSKKGQAKKIFSLPEVSGTTGCGYATYNAKKGFLGAIPIGGATPYHLLHINNSSNGENIVKVVRKSKWHPQYVKDNMITDVDFDLEGKRVASFLSSGLCLVSDLDTDNYIFDLQIGNANNLVSRCRWSTNISEPIIFVKYNENLLNIIDTEKELPILKSPCQLEKNYSTIWIDMSNSDANLLASGGNDQNIKVYDRRHSKIVRTFDNLHQSSILCVRWDPMGDKLSSASSDKTAKVIDFSSGKVLYSRNTFDDKPAYSACFL